MPDSKAPASAKVKAEAPTQGEPPAFATPTVANPGDRGWRPPLLPVTPAPIPAHWQHRKDVAPTPNPTPAPAVVPHEEPKP